MLNSTALVIPAAYHSVKGGKGPHVGISSPDSMSILSAERMRDLDEESQAGLLVISRGTAILLLLVYVGYLIFQLKTHADLFLAPEPEDGEEGEPKEEAHMNVASASVS